MLKVGILGVGTIATIPASAEPLSFAKNASGDLSLR